MISKNEIKDFIFNILVIAVLFTGFIFFYVVDEQKSHVAEIEQLKLKHSMNIGQLEDVCNVLSRENTRFKNENNDLKEKIIQLTINEYSTNEYQIKLD